MELRTRERMAFVVSIGVAYPCATNSSILSRSLLTFHLRLERQKMLSYLVPLSKKQIA